MKKLCTLILGAAVAAAACAAERVIITDFTRAGHGWRAMNHVKDAVQTPSGYQFTSTDIDPWCVSPKLTFPAMPAGTTLVRLELATAPCNASSLQLFWSFGKPGFSELKSVRLKPVGARANCTRFAAELSADSVTPGAAWIRIDPPGGKDTWTYKSLTATFVKPLWTYAPSPVPPQAPFFCTVELVGRTWNLSHDAAHMGAFKFYSGTRCTEHNACEPVVWLDDGGNVQSIKPASLPLKIARSADGRRIDASVTWKDSDGRTWKFARTFRAKDDDTLSISTRVDVDRTVRLLHLPWITLLADRASAGHKVQALFPGIEYLEDEPSSNSKEIRTPEANRLIPAAEKLCYPLMLLTQKDGWTSLAWDLPAPDAAAFSPVFDTPDRVFKSGGHLFGLWSPAVGSARRDSDLTLYDAQPFSGGVCNATLRAGDETTVTDALATLLPPSSLPELPPVSLADYCTTLANGWLDSAIHEGDLYRHATVSDHFKAGPACDAPTLMMWLASVTPDAAAKARLLAAAKSAIAALPEKRERRGWGRKISHVGRPVAPLVYGDAMGYAREMDRNAKEIARWLARGYRVYRRAPDAKHDYAETLGTNQCNGFTAMSATAMLRGALWTGDEKKIADAIAALDKMTVLYSGSVPRGAQPWEMPLHTPDICASAKLVYCYVYGYLLKPDPVYLREARAWARTGLTMVYLAPPRGVGPVARYATTGVMGATNWTTPNWIGRPVQWCGLDYGAALFELAKIDPDPKQAAYWRKVAQGIAACGQQMSHPAEDGPKQGLLPDSFNLIEQTRYPVPINPGTLQENAAEAVGRPYYTVAHPVAGRPELIHVPGGVTAGAPKAGESLRCRLAPWPETPFRTVISRVARPKSVTWNGKDVPFTWKDQVLVVELTPAATGDLVVR